MITDVVQLRIHVLWITGIFTFLLPARTASSLRNILHWRTRTAASLSLHLCTNSFPLGLPHYHIIQCGRALDCQVRGRRCESCLWCFSLHPTYLQLWGLWVPGEESWGRSNTWEVYQDGQMESNPSLNVLVQSAKPGSNGR